MRPPSPRLPARNRTAPGLVRLLAVHETAEEEVVRPFARSHLDDGETVVGQRIEEEEKAGQALALLDGMDTDSPEFLDRFAALRQGGLGPADNEERYEFARLAEVADEGRPESLARAVRAAEALAPPLPHPSVGGPPIPLRSHPGTDTALKNMAVGPVAAVVDRTRDAVRKAVGRAGRAKFRRDRAARSALKARGTARPATTAPRPADGTTLRRRRSAQARQPEGRSGVRGSREWITFSGCPN